MEKRDVIRDREARNDPIVFLEDILFHYCRTKRNGKETKDSGRERSSQEACTGEIVPSEWCRISRTDHLAVY